MTVSPAAAGVPWPPPAVPVFPAGYGPQPSDFAGWWQDELGFLQQKIVFRAREAVTPTVLPSSQATTVIGYDAVDEDPWSGWNPGPASWGPPAGYSGWFQVCVTVFTNIPQTGTALRAKLLAPQFQSDLATIACGNGHANGVEGQETVYLVGGQDTVSGAAQYLNASSSVSTSLILGRQSALTVMWLGQ